jgi:hypothetical protein
MSTKPSQWQPAARSNPVEQAFSAARLRIGDVVEAIGFDPSYPLMIVAIAGGRIAIGSPLWPPGANIPVELHQITSRNGEPCEFPKVQTKKSKRRKPA